MSNKLDKLFRDKLSDMTVTPSADAWARVSQAGAKKNSVWMWRMAAAVAAMLVVAGALVWWPEEETTPVAVQEPTVMPAPATVQPAVAETQSPVKTEPARVVVQKIQPQPVLAVEVANMVEPEETIAETVVEEAVESTVAEVTVTQREETAAAPVVLVYTLESVEEETAAPVENPAGTWERVAQFARDIKNGEGNVGLRDFKEELFALNFRKKETPKQ